MYSKKQSTRLNDFHSGKCRQHIKIKYTSKAVMLATTKQSPTEKEKRDETEDRTAEIYGYK